MSRSASSVMRVDRLHLLVARVGLAHPGGDHPQAEQVLGDGVVDLPGDPGRSPARASPLARSRSAASAEPSWRAMVLKFASSRPTSSRPEVGRVTAVVAVGDRDSGSFEAAHPADEPAGGEQPERHPDRDDGDEQRVGRRQQRAGAGQLAQLGPGAEGVGETRSAPALARRGS